jgi:Uma2 family endonuclease
MATVIGDRRYTPDDLLKLPGGNRFELVDGQLVETEKSLLSAFVAGRVTELLSAHSRSQNLGPVFNSDASYRCFPFDPVMVRRPDVSFIQRLRMRAEYLTGHSPIAPDLAVEVASPNDGLYDVQDKVDEYLAAGVRLVWLINPETRIVQVYRRDGTVSHLRGDAELTGEDVLPGLRCTLGELFKPPPVGG